MKVNILALLIAICLATASKSQVYRNHIKQPSITKTHSQTLLYPKTAQKASQANNSNGCRLDSSYYFYNTDTTRVCYSYDANGNQTNTIYQDWHGYWVGSNWTYSWVTNGKDTSTYDANGHLTSMTEQILDGYGWENSYRQIDSYDVSGNQTSYVEQIWSAFHSAWVNRDSGAFVYDVNNYLISETWKNWDTTTSVWVNSSSTSYTNNTNGKPLNYIQQSWNGSAWVNSYENTIIYNTNGDAISNLGQSWNGFFFQDNYKDTITYSGYQTTITGQEWNGNTWVNNDQQIYTHDTYGNLTSDELQQWDYFTWGFSEERVYYYSCIQNGIAQILDKKGRISIYPNPTTSVLHIDIENKNTEIKIYDMLGNVVLTSYSSQIDVSFLQSGIYFLQIENNVQKFVRN